MMRKPLISLHIRRLMVALLMSIAGPPAPRFAQQERDAPAPNTLTLPNRQPRGAIPPAVASHPQPETSLEVPSLKLRSQPGYEQVTVTVTDTSGNYVANLKEDDFRILEDG